MPFTPFHLGAGLLAKAAVDRRISLMSFSVAQVAMDIEPGIRMLQGSDLVHGSSHTLVGALVIGAIVSAMSMRPMNDFAGRWNTEVTHYGAGWLAIDSPCRRGAVTFGAFFGTVSHVLLDALIHYDMSPLAPLIGGNPLLGSVEHDAVYAGCAVATALGAAAWAMRRYFGRPSSD